MRCLIFAKRCTKEILRDPLTIFFSLGFPVVLLLLLSAIQANVPVELFEISHLTPGVTVFGLSFMSLFSATLIAKDRESAFLQRLYTTPLRARDVILGYTLPLIPISVAQTLICYLLAFALKLPCSIGVLYAIIGIIPVSVLFISIGLLCGSILSVKQAGGICGALLTNLSAWLSGVWFDLELVGGVFMSVARALPFYHAVAMERALLKADFATAMSHFPILAIYAAALSALAIVLFTAQAKRH